MSSRVPEIGPGELASLLAGGGAIVLLDVRESVERAYCAIPVHVAVVDLHVPVSQVPARLGELAAACAGRSTVVYCHHGVRSRKVAEWLALQGMEGLLNLTGGIDAWTTEVDPQVPRY